MTTSPPYPIERVISGEKDVLPDDWGEPHTDCECDEPEHRAYPEDGEFDPTAIKYYDKWQLWGCRSCWAVWWHHDVRADYGIPEMDATADYL